ncbi:MAG: hypothetical protein ACFBRM_14610 [Pikeienuella sp.]
MRSDGPQIIPPGQPGGEGARRVRAPGWIARNRARLEQAKALGAQAVLVAPLPARVPLAGACLAIDAALLAEDARTGAIPRNKLGLRGAGLALEAVTLVAATRRAPTALKLAAPRLLAARRLLTRLERRAPN